MDESGNSGDIINRNVDLSFASQPLFSLSCIQIEEITEFSSLINSLKKKHKIQGNELKSTSIYKSKEKFLLEVCDYIKEQNIPFFIEVVDKKFNICSTIVNHHILPPYFVEDKSDGSTQLLRNIVADYMSNHMPENCYMSFFSACRLGTEEALLNSMNILKDFFLGIKDNKDMFNVSEFVEDSIDEYFLIKKQIKNDEEAVKKFIPIPDINKRDSEIHLLPHVSSFSNILARVNLYNNKNMKDVKFIHDKQDHFDEILREIKKQVMEINRSEGSPKLKTADYDITQEFSLEFADSEKSIGVQVADILAGFVSRYFQEILYENKSISDSYHEIFYSLNESTIEDRGVGINMVFPHSKLDGSHITYTHNF